MSDMSGEFLESVQASEPETTTEQLAEIEGQPQPVQVREGRWRTRGGDICNVTPTPEDDGRKERWPWWDAHFKQTWTSDGRKYLDDEHPLDLVEYLGTIEQQPQPEPQPQEPPADTADELRSEVSYVQRLLGESRQRVTHLEELVTSLRTINTAQERAVERADDANDDLQNRLKAVAAEWAQQAETSRRLQIDLAQFEALQPMAAACSTAQTMVRDMLGHMRCLVSLNSTTDRSNFCTLLESILEVFDDAECDDDVT